MSYVCASGDSLTGAFTSTYDINTTAKFTIAQWILKTPTQWGTPVQGRQFQIGVSTSTSTNSVFFRQNVTADQARGGSVDDAGDVREDFTGSIASDDTWLLQVMVFDGDSDRELFINGTPSGSPDTTTHNMDPIGGAISVGNQLNSDNNGLCIVGPTGCWDIALSDAEVASLWTSAETGPHFTQVQGSRCIGYWPLTTDQSTHANQGTDAGGLLTVISGMVYSSASPTMTSGGGNPSYYYAQQ